MNKTNKSMATKIGGHEEFFTFSDNRNNCETLNVRGG